MERRSPLIWERDRERFGAEELPIVVVDSRCRIVYFNEAWVTLQNKRNAACPQIEEPFRLVPEDRLLTSKELYSHATITQGLQEVIEGRQLSFTREYLCGTREAPIPCQVSIFRYQFTNNQIGAQLWHEHLDSEHDSADDIE